MLAASILLCILGCAQSRNERPSESREAIFVSNPGGDYVTTYDLNASEDAQPIATLAGSPLDRILGAVYAGGSGLEGPAGVAVDYDGDVYVSNFGGGWLGRGSIAIFRPGSTTGPIAELLVPQPS
jgi:hypothetical protein